MENVFICENQHNAIDKVVTHTGRGIYTHNCVQVIGGVLQLSPIVAKEVFYTNI